MSDPADCDEWDDMVDLGANAAMTAMGAAFRLSEAHGLSDCDKAIALAYGGVIGIIQALVCGTSPGSAGTIEQYTCALIRGIFRGADGPLNEDGTPFAAPVRH